MNGVELVEEMARRFQAGDVDGAFELLHPEFRIQQPESLPHGGWHRGRAGMGEMGAAFAAHWDRTIADPRVLGCGGAVVQITTQTWTARRTGRAATVDVVELFSFAGGLVAEIRVFQQDTHLLLATLDGPLLDTPKPAMGH
ncbi:nuclear transport factor 2 family protein [Actinomadura chokoriensis]|uniref:Nuclear transport factor 2 family protein n=1 Tax=Actinomadura chokoriensis TaxID=454156 RepID=A0ABV4QTC3_9ACTN